MSLAGLMLVFVPLIKGGNRPIPLLITELLALLMLGFALARFSELRRHLSLGFGLVLAVWFALPLLQLIPLPVSWVPGFDAYQDALASLGLAQAGQGWQTLSLVPYATESAWLTMLLPLSVFLLVVMLDERSLMRLVYLFIGMAVFQALLGLIQFGDGSESFFRFNTEFHKDSAVGTYANRNHFAALLYMALPLALGVLASQVGNRSQDTRRYQSRRRGGFLSGLFHGGFRINYTFLMAAAGIAILLGVIFSRSRTGISLTMLAILLSAILFARHLGGRRSVGVTAIFSVIGLALAIEVGLAPVLDRFALDAAAADARWPIFDSAIVGIGQFFPMGSGLGTFPDVYRRFQPDEVGRFVNHAHNDYIEFLFEGGLLAALVLLGFAFFFLRRWPALLRGGSWGTFRFMQVGAGISLLMLALHGLTDYNWHIPANAVYFAFLAAVFMHQARTTSHAERPAKATGPDDEVRPASTVATSAEADDPGAVPTGANAAGRGPAASEPPAPESPVPSATRNPFSD